MADKDDKTALIKYRTEFDKWLGEFHCYSVIVGVNDRG